MVDVKSDNASFKKSADELLKFYDPAMVATMRETAKVWASVMSKYTPPNIGKATIPSKFYKREIVNYRQRMKSDECSKGEKRYARFVVYKLKKPYRVKIKNKGSNSFFYEYVKTAGEARSIAAIHMRGLMKAGYGLNFPQLGVTFPKSIRTLVGKSPGIVKYRYNAPASCYATPDLFRLTVDRSQYIVENSGYWMGNAERQADDRSYKFEKARSAALAKKLIEL